MSQGDYGLAAFLSMGGTLIQEFRQQCFEDGEREAERYHRISNEMGQHKARSNDLLTQPARAYVPGNHLHFPFLDFLCT